MVSRLKDTLLLVGDSSSDRAQLRKIFDATFNLLEAENAAQALLLLGQNIDCISAVLADLPLSEENGIRALARALAGEDQSTPLLLFIPHGGTGEDEERAFNLGVTDVVYKPYTPEGVQRRLQILLDLCLHKLHLETLVTKQNETIHNAKQVMLDALSAIIEHRSSESGNHVMRIRRFTKILLEEVALNCPEYKLTDDDVAAISSASTLHDIGKISIPDNVLNKPGKLTEEEYEIMKSHTTVGSELVLTLTGIASEKELRYAYNIALYHHERWDGGGYPCGLAGDDIPICAQVVGLADAFDALTSPRVYKPAYSHSTAINMILNGECGEFSPSLLACFKIVRNQFSELALKYADGYSPKADNITLPLPGPDWSKAPLNSLEYSQLKYSTLLHYVNATVIEADMGANLYHVVYNPNPELSLLPEGGFTDFFTQLTQNPALHPDDRQTAAQLKDYYENRFFSDELFRRNFRLRLYSSRSSQYLPYSFTTLRVNTQAKEQRSLIFVIHPEADAPAESASAQWKNSAALYGITSTVLRCLCDNRMTIDAGAAELYPLLGIGSAEIGRDFGGSYSLLVHPDDREALAETVVAAIADGTAAEAEYRLLGKGGKELWVLDKLRFFTETDGQTYVYHSLYDNSRARAAFDAYQYSIARNQLIIDQSGGIIFEWDLLSDTMYCSPKWQEHFGYIPVSKNYGKQMGIATHFHPDDLPLVRSAIEQIKSNADTLVIDVRIADSNAKYLWTRITATAYLDRSGNLARIIGMLQDVDALKRAELALRERADLDSLTKLFNKDTAHDIISDRLGDREEGTISALMVIDLDNFKLVNDNYGHLYGDAVLSQVGATLKKLFRDNDVIGRIGGDEFLVFMSGIPNVELAEARCRLLLSTFSDLLEQNAPGMNVSISIGLALVPEHGTSYTDLFRKADEALYMAKSMGKNTFVLYNPETALPMDDIVLVSTRIDSDEQPGMADSSFVRYVFRSLYESSDTFGTISDILSYVGQQLNVSRVYIFENNDDNTTCSNTFEWCNEGISPEKDSLQNVSYIEDIPGWPEVYNERGIFYCTDISSLAPQFRSILEPQGIKSMLQCSIRDNGVFRGYVGFDECHVNRLWTQDQIGLLEFLSEVLALFLMKKRNQDKVAALAESLQTILDLQDEWLYVIDPETCALKFLNAKCRQITNSAELGTPCYKAFMSRSTRCKNCPAISIGTPIVADSPKFGGLISATGAEINWNGEKACLITCRNLSDLPTE
ncbi:MAG: diguanylate cyclase [Oscillospiraceae bacterium]|nr:diguanylate cyclase [Oscillospiraceae bacterium]